MTGELGSGHFPGHEALVHSIELDEMNLVVESIGMERRRHDRREFDDPNFPPEEDNRKGPTDRRLPPVIR